jgi:hypothetical protein
MIHLLHGSQAIDRYFGGERDAPTVRAAMKRVRRCDDCRRRYERHLLFERARPPGSGDDRLWRSIQVTASAPPARASRPRVALLVAAFAGVALFVGVRRHTSDDGFVARGVETAAAAPALHLYRNVAGRAEPVSESVRTGDGLLLAYSNPSDLPYLMVLAVDGRGGVHWYYPAYERLGEDPAAVPIRARALGVELGEEIRHPLPPGRLQVIALFLPAPRRVLDVERDVAAAKGSFGALAGPGGVTFQRALEVTP